MRLRDDVDVSTIDWNKQAHLARRYAESLPPGTRRSVEIDRALACEAIAHSREVRSVAGIQEPIGILK
jgi:hypothetical protein